MSAKGRARPGGPFLDPAFELRPAKPVAGEPADDVPDVRIEERRREPDEVDAPHGVVLLEGDDEDVGARREFLDDEDGGDDERELHALIVPVFREDCPAVR